MAEIIDGVRAVISALETCNINYAVGGSFASGMWGNPRQTRDMDISLHLPMEAVDSFIAAIGDGFMVDYLEVSNASTSSEEYRSFQLLHFGTMFKFDMFVRHHTAYDQMVLSRAVTVELFPGTPARCYTAEDILIQKLRWFELGNRVSDRQWNDIVQILEVQDGRLDNQYLELWARNFEVIDLLSSARGQIRA